MKKVITGYALALIFWFFMFSPWTADLLNFWGTMFVAAGVLTAYSLWFGKDYIKENFKFEKRWVTIGLASAVLLYLIFFAGNYFSGLLFDFSHSQIQGIYSTKEQAGKLVIALALLFWIGPAEEIFWRSYAQRELEKHFRPIWAYLLNALVYAFVHIWAFNFMLFMAALICGLFWGWMYYRYKNIIPGIISHAVWDVVIFVILPING